MKKVVFVSTAITAPYVIKKVKAFRRAGYETILYAYNRGSGFERDDNQELGKVCDLGYFPSGKGYIKKLWAHIWTLRRIFRENDPNSIFILFTFDLALINLIFYRKDFIYHISDLTYAKVNNRFIVSTFRKIDQILVKSSKLTIITSLGFKNFLFNGKHCPDNIEEIPNLLQEDNPYQRKDISYVTDINSLSFGFVGLNRYLSPLCFAKVIGSKFPQHKFFFYGNGFDNLMDEINQLTIRYPNIYAKGRFNSSTELENIYKNIDILVCCYDVTNTNVRVAEPNKLYEAIFFNKPIIVSSCTFLEEKVKNLGVGYGVEAMNADAVAEFVKNITLDDLNQKLKAISRINTSELIDDGDKVVKLILKYLSEK